MPDQHHLEKFGEFCLRKKEVGGPDVHMKAAGIGTADAGDERPWRLAVYNNFAACSPAAVVSSHWQQDDVLKYQSALENWITVNWAGLPIRQNRRPARSVKKLTKSLVTLAQWMKDEYPYLGEMSYPDAWASLNDVFTWGRYVKIKYLETCRLYLGFTYLESPNIQAAGGWSPRKAISFIYPEYADIIANKERNDKRTLAHVYSVADEIRAYVSDNWVQVSNYELEALLCNYKQTLSTRKAFYVGRTIDSELEIDRKIRTYWGDDPYNGTFDFFETRDKAFPWQCLGENNGWDGVRKDLSPLLLENDIVWSDVVYDYTASKEDLANPVRWT